MNEKIRTNTTIGFTLFCITFSVLTCSISTASGQFLIEKIEDNGNDANRMVLIIMGDGYTSFQMDDFHQDVDHVLHQFYSVSPWAEYRNFINIYRIDVISNESGADHPSRDEYVDTALSATYDAYGIGGLLAANDTKALDIASQVPMFDAVIVLVNDETYGGSSGATIVLSNHYKVEKIILHEIGHLIGKLADEYELPYPGYPAGDSEPNVTYHTDLEYIPWKKWIEGATPLPTPERDSTYEVGLFEGARYKTAEIFRPTYNSIMRNLDGLYGPVNTEVLILALHDYVDIIDRYIPDQSAMLTSGVSSSYTFKIELVSMSTETILVEWKVDGLVQDTENSTVLNVDQADLKQGDHTVAVSVLENTSLVRHDPQALLSSSRVWHFVKETASGALVGRVENTLNSCGIKGALIEAEDGDYTTIAEADGTFRISPVPEGSYTVIASSERYSPARIDTVKVIDGDSSEVTISLTPLFDTYSISGTVTGQVKEGITIQLQKGEAIFLTTKTDADGRYCFNGLESDYYTVIPDCDNCFLTPSLYPVTVESTDITDIGFNSVMVVCPAQLILDKQSSSLAILRQLRDKVLAKHALGRQYTNLYYTHAPELTKLIIEYPEIRKYTRELIEVLLPDMQSLVAGNGVSIRAATIDTLVDFMDFMITHASPELKNSLYMVRNNLENGMPLQEWSINDSEF